MTNGKPTPAATARRLIRATDRATLATALAAPEGSWPYASLVLVAVDYDASPLLLISDPRRTHKEPQAGPADFITV